MQRVAAAALAEPPEVTERITASRRLHGTVAAQVHRLLTEAGIHCRPPEAAFYLYPDFTAHRETLGVATGQELADLLLDRHGIGILPAPSSATTPTHCAADWPPACCTATRKNNAPPA